MKMNCKDELKKTQKSTNSYIQPYNNLDENKSKKTFNLGLNEFCKLTHFIDKTLYHPHSTPPHPPHSPPHSKTNIVSFKESTPYVI